MKRSEIEVGKEYAYSDYRPTRYGTPKGTRCLVLGFEQVETKTHTWSSPKTTNKVRIRLLEGNSGKGTEIFVTGAKLLWDWETEQRNRKALAKEKDNAEKALAFATKAHRRAEKKMPFAVFYVQGPGHVTPVLKVNVHGEENIEKFLKLLGA